MAPLVDLPLRVGVPIPGLDPRTGGGYTLQASLFAEIARHGWEDDSKKCLFKALAFSDVDYSNATLEYSVNPDHLIDLRGDHGERVPSKLDRIMSRFVRRSNDNLRSRRQALLDARLEHEIDYLWAFSTGGVVSQHVPYAVIAWDLQHRLQPMFPEVSRNGKWAQRENECQSILPRATTVITGTQRGASEIIRFYGVDPQRVLVNPLPAPQRPSFNFKSISVCRNYSIQCPYIYYPAQFWPHKNHYNLLCALRLLVEQGVDISLVLSGSDKGSETAIRALADSLDISSRVCFLGFIPGEHVWALLEQARALCFPSFFGPDNIPPLEAMVCGTPVLAADVPGAAEQLGKAALLFDPSSPLSIANAIEEILSNPQVGQTLRAEGLKLVATRTTAAYLAAMESHISSLRPMLMAVKHS